MPTDPTTLDAAALGRAYRDGSLAPIDVTEAFLAKIAPGDVYRVVTRDRALEQASRATHRFSAGTPLGPLDGVPVALKDLVDTEGDVTAAGSRVLAERKPATADAPVAARLDAAGAVFLGKTNMTELAFSGVGINPHFGTPGCALDPERIPGGSSSGSAVAVASDLATIAVGSDTGGSVRIPSSFNGLVGLKTTDGALPTDGLQPLSTTLDTVGPMARTVDDAWVLYLALRAEAPRPLPKLPGRLRLWAPDTVLLADLDSAVADAHERALVRLESAGHEVARGSWELLAEIPELYGQFGTFAAHEAYALYAEMIEAHGERMDPRVAKRILAAEGGTSRDYLQLAWARARLQRQAWEEARSYHAIVSPTVAILPPRIADLEADDAAFFRSNGLILRNTMIFNFLGGPAATVPMATTDEGLSVGLMFATAPQQDATALAIAKRAGSLFGTSAFGASA